MRGRSVSLGMVVWIVIGLIVAANHNYLKRLDTLSRILSAILAVAVWPLVVLKVHFGI
jgi:ABC-type anion transport system duplicated permease subunit